MPKRELLYYLVFALMLTALLLVVGNNLPVVASFKWLWAPLFLIFSLFYYSNIFLSRPGIAVLLYGVLYVGILQYTIWQFASDWYIQAIFDDFYAMLVFVILYSILRKRNYQIEWIKITRWAFVFIVVTGIMTIYATYLNPLVIRASYSDPNSIEDYSKLYRLGFGSYGYMTAVVSLLPILIYFIKLKYTVWFNKKVLVILLIFFLFVLLRAQIFANILVAALIMIFSFIGTKRFNRSIAYTSIFILILLLTPKNYYAKIFNGVSSFFDQQSLVHQKFADMAIFIENPRIDEYNYSTQTGSRVSRYPALFKAFKASPIFGDASYYSKYNQEVASGAHLYWMSRLTLWGIFGFIGYLIILKNIFKSVIPIFDKEFRFYYLLSLLSVIILGLMKNISGREPYIMLLIIIPGLYQMKKYLTDKNLIHKVKN